MIPAGPWYIDDTLTFTVVTHRFDTGALTDADAVPAYRVYEDETGTAILTGNMAKLDDAGTTGFYSEQITLSAANGFEVGKSYSVYVSAAVNSVTGGICGGFKVIAAPVTAAQVNAEVVDALATDTYAEPGQGNPAASTSLSAKIGYLYKNWRNRKTQTADEWALYADDGTTKDQEAAVSDDGTTLVKGEVVTGA